MSTPSVISLIILAGTLIYAIYGAYRGAIRQLGSVAAFLVGFLGARLLGPRVTAVVELPPVVSYVVIFALIFVIVMLLARVLKLTFKMLLLAPVDRLCGALIGAAKWLILASILLNAYLLCDPQTQLLGEKPTQWTLGLLPKLFGLAQTYLS